MSLQEREQRSALLGDNGEGMAVTERRGEQHLQHQFVAGRRIVVRHELPPRGELLPTRSRQRVALPLGLAVTVGKRPLDESVTREPIECRVDLTDIERPDAAGRGLELDLQLMAVPGAIRKQRQ